MFLNVDLEGTDYSRFISSLLSWTVSLGLWWLWWWGAGEEGLVNTLRERRPSYSVCIA